MSNQGHQVVGGGCLGAIFGILLGFFGGYFWGSEGHFPWQEPASKETAGLLIILGWVFGLIGAAVCGIGGAICGAAFAVRQRSNRPEQIQRPDAP
jgi:hypothetical protein